MKSSKILARILAMLGFQMQSCVGTDEYGCPYTTYKTNGTVKDENGNKVQGAEVSVKVDVIAEKKNHYGEKSKDTIPQPTQTVYTNKKGIRFYGYLESVNNKLFCSILSYTSGRTP